MAVQGRRRALVIGIGRYGSGLPALPVVVDEARQLAELLGSPVGGYDVSLRLDLDRAQLLDALGAFFASAQTGDTLLLWLGGHADGSPRGDFVFYGVDAGRPDVPTGLGGKDIAAAARHSGALNLFAVVDTSHAEAAQDALRGAAANVAVLAACRADQVAAGGRVSFTRSLLTELSRPAGHDEPPELDVRVLFDAAQADVLRVTLAQAPVLSITGHPTAPVAFRTVPVATAAPTAAERRNRERRSTRDSPAAPPSTVEPATQAPDPDPDPDPAGSATATLPQQRVAPPPGPRTDVAWQHDGPAEKDLLRRRDLARVIAQRLAEIESGSFALHLDGPWGSGKSSLLRFVEDDLAPRFLVVPFNAWQQSRLGPPWWSLLTAVRAAIVADRPWWRRPGLRLRETGSRVARTGAPFVLAMVLLAVAVAALAFAWWPHRPGVGTGTDVLKLLGAALVVIAPLWAGAQLAGRFLLWQSVRGAKVFEEASANPLREIHAHFRWLSGRTRRRVILMIDDLDRCDQSYVVDFLETLQTLVRDDRTGVCVVVAADGAWLRRSFELRYADFSSALAEPGRPLGDLFLDKLFQLTVPMPALGAATQLTYLSNLLDIDEHGQATAAEIGELKERIDARRGDERAILEVLGEASTPAREAVSGDAAVALSAPETRKATEHALRRYCALLEPNPRSIKLFLNTYAMLRAVRTVEGNVVDMGALALWCIVVVRWPSLATHLARDPDAVAGIREPLWVADRFPAELRGLAASAAVREVVDHADGGPLTASVIRLCRGAP